jgi:hypothetical protein
MPDAQAAEAAVDALAALLANRIPLDDPRCQTLVGLVRACAAAPPGPAAAEARAAQPETVPPAYVQHAPRALPYQVAIPTLRAAVASNAVRAQQNTSIALGSVVGQQASTYAPVKLSRDADSAANIPAASNVTDANASVAKAPKGRPAQSAIPRSVFAAAAVATKAARSAAAAEARTGASFRAERPPEESEVDQTRLPASTAAESGGTPDAPTLTAYVSEVGVNVTYTAISKQTAKDAQATDLSATEPVPPTPLLEPDQLSMSPAYIFQMKAQLAAYRAVCRGVDPAPELLIASAGPKRLYPVQSHILADYCTRSTYPISVDRQQTQSHVDYDELAAERDRRVRTRIDLRLAELADLPLDLPVDVRRRAVIELKSLSLLQKQRVLRESVTALMHTLLVPKRVPGFTPDAAALAKFRRPSLNLDSTNAAPTGPTSREARDRIRALERRHREEQESRRLKSQSQFGIAFLAHCPACEESAPQKAV